METRLFSPEYAKVGLPSSLQLRVKALGLRCLFGWLVGWLVGWLPLPQVFTDDDNADLVATDTQKNTVYVVAKRTEVKH